MNGSHRYTPDNITELGPNEIFVFGSNAAGQHYGGAAHTAHTLFGAEWGVGEGITGQCYALPTMEGWESFVHAAGKFVGYAISTPNNTYYLTRVGCGIAGYSDEQVATLFRDAPDNVILPKGWKQKETK